MNRLSQTPILLITEVQYELSVLPAYPAKLIDLTLIFVFWLVWGTFLIGSFISLFKTTPWWFSSVDLTGVFVPIKSMTGFASGS